MMIRAMNYLLLLAKINILTINIFNCSIDSPTILYLFPQKNLINISYYNNFYYFYHLIIIYRDYNYNHPYHTITFIIILLLSLNST